MLYNKTSRKETFKPVYLVGNTPGALEYNSNGLSWKDDRYKAQGLPVCYKGIF